MNATAPRVVALLIFDPLAKLAFVRLRLVDNESGGFPQLLNLYMNDMTGERLEQKLFDPRPSTSTSSVDLPWGKNIAKLKLLKATSSKDQVAVFVLDIYTEAPSTEMTIEMGE